MNNEEYTEVRLRDGGQRGDTLLFLLVLLFVFAAYVIKNLLDSIGLPGSVIAIALMIVVAVWLLRFRMAAFRYTLKESEIVVERITANKRSSVEAVIKLEGAALGDAGAARRVYLTAKDKKIALALTDSAKTAYYIDASDELRSRIEKALSGSDEQQEHDAEHE